MHSLIIAIAASAAIGLSTTHMLPPLAVTISLLAIAVAVFGVPHGGLDHWSGRTLLSQVLSERFRRFWPLVFFSLYGLTSFFVVIGWWLSPITTVIAFVLLSAWHFGTEDNLANPVLRIGWGGLAIWIPSIFRGDEMTYLLREIMPLGSDAPIALGTILFQWFGGLVMLAGIILAVQKNSSITPLDLAWGGLWVLLFAVTPIVISFGIYFCGWHSVRGLKRLRREHKQTWPQLIWAVMPLSIAAIALTIITGLIFASGQTFDRFTIQLTFIGLSAIAVPHMILHEPRFVAWSKQRATSGSRLMVEVLR